MKKLTMLFTIISAIVCVLLVANYVGLGNELIASPSYIVDETEPEDSSSEPVTPDDSENLSVTPSEDEQPSPSEQTTPSEPTSPEVNQTDPEIAAEFFSTLDTLSDAELPDYFEELCETSIKMIGVSSDAVVFEDEWMKCDYSDDYHNSGYSKYIEMFGCTWELRILFAKEVVHFITFGTVEEEASINYIVQLFDNTYERSWMDHPDNQHFSWGMSVTRNKYVLFGVSPSYSETNSVNNGFHTHYNDALEIHFERCYA